MGEKEVVGQIDEDESLDSSGESVSLEEETADSPEQVDESTAELARVKDQLLRKAAELQNYRRRINKERNEWPLRARAHVVKSLLPVADDMERMEQSMKTVVQGGADDTAFDILKGVELVFRNFFAVLDKLGVKPIEALGEGFDVDLHEAVMQAPAPEGVGPNIVIHETQRGYVLGDNVLRHAQVIVSAETYEEADSDPLEDVSLEPAIQ